MTAFIDVIMITDADTPMWIDYIHKVIQEWNILKWHLLFDLIMGI